jgi:hypothetical protein
MLDQTAQRAAIDRSNRAAIGRSGDRSIKPDLPFTPSYVAERRR